VTRVHAQQRVNVQQPEIDIRLLRYWRAFRSWARRWHVACV